MVKLFSQLLIVILVALIFFIIALLLIPILAVGALLGLSLLAFSSKKIVAIFLVILGLILVILGVIALLY